MSSYLSYVLNKKSNLDDSTTLSSKINCYDNKNFKGNYSDEMKRFSPDEIKRTSSDEFSNYNLQKSYYKASDSYISNYSSDNNKIYTPIELNSSGKYMSYSIHGSNNQFRSICS